MTTQAAADLPLITVDSWDAPFDPRAISQLEPLLPAFVAARRWFRSKARAIQCIAIDDVVPMPADSCILFLRIEYRDGACDNYLLPVSVSRHQDPEDPLARIAAPGGAEGILHSALFNTAFRDALLAGIHREEKFEGRVGDFIALPTSALGGHSEYPIESFVSRAEQSNTSVIYRGRYILKLFRKVEPGVNPDIEIGAFLTELGFKNTPAVLGTLEYRAKGGDAVAEYAAGILQQFVPNRGDAWQYTLESLGGFFERALPRQEQPAVFLHPLDLMNEDIPAEAAELLGEYADSARLLGKRTAEMHAALAVPDSPPDFAPERFTRDEAEKLYWEMLEQAGITFDLLRRTEGPDTASLLDVESRVLERFSGLKDHSIDAVRIRCHGDYHLGQVLWTGSDFMIIDFEGEPARPLAARRAKMLAMRDVAGMVRSFQYAAFAALFGQVPGVSAEAATRSAVESWAAYWTAWVNAAYLRGYFDTAGTHSFMPPDGAQRKTLFDAFLLQKALYEVAYELNNRPDWVRIPLRGILSLVN
ncbi:MAG: putative maltokinase [Acidobacteriaceae bacterium]|nr:putative maltokinase [Acidobacteriaceae bacterium]